MHGQANKFQSVFGKHATQSRWLHQLPQIGHCWETTKTWSPKTPMRLFVNLVHKENVQSSNRLLTTMSKDSFWFGNRHSSTKWMSHAIQNLKWFWLNSRHAWKKDDFQKELIPSLYLPKFTIALKNVWAAEKQQYNWQRCKNVGILHTLHSQRICTACNDILTSRAFEETSKLRKLEKFQVHILLVKRRCSTTCLCVELVTAHRTLKEFGLNLVATWPHRHANFGTSSSFWNHNLPAALPCSLHKIRESQHVGSSTLIVLHRTSCSFESHYCTSLLFTTFYLLILYTRKSQTCGIILTQSQVSMQIQS